MTSDTSTTPVRAGFGLDEASLARWMSEHVAGYGGPLHVEQFKGGQSNPTYKLVTPQAQYVLRRKPPGQLLPGAHAVDREARVMMALCKTGFPVPAIHALCNDDAVLGTPFYVMDLVEGRIFWDAGLPEVSRTDRPAYFDAMNRTLADLHGDLEVIPAAVPDSPQQWVDEMDAAFIGAIDEPALLALAALICLTQSSPVARRWNGAQRQPWYCHLSSSKTWMMQACLAIIVPSAMPCQQVAKSCSIIFRLLVRSQSRCQLSTASCIATPT